MSVVLQNITAGLVIAAAVVYLGVRSAKLLRGKSNAGCGTGCNSCPSHSSDVTLVQLDATTHDVLPATASGQASHE